MAVWAVVVGSILARSGCAGAGWGIGFDLVGVGLIGIGLTGVISALGDSVGSCFGAGVAGWLVADACGFVAGGALTSTPLMVGGVSGSEGAECQPVATVTAAPWANSTIPNSKTLDHLFSTLVTCRCRRPVVYTYQACWIASAGRGFTSTWRATPFLSWISTVTESACLP